MFKVRRTWSSSVLVILATLAASASAQQYLVNAQLEYQRSRLEAYRLSRVAQGLLGGALAPGEYSWTIDIRCVTPVACAQAFGSRLLPDGEESFTFVARLFSDGTRMRYSGASLARGSSSGALGARCGSAQAGTGTVVCVTDENGEAFVAVAPAHPLALLEGRPLLWVGDAALWPLTGGGAAACACGGSGGLATPTVALPGTLDADDYATGKELPTGVELTVRLVKVQ